MLATATHARCAEPGGRELGATAQPAAKYATNPFIV